MTNGVLTATQIGEALLRSVAPRVQEVEAEKRTLELQVEALRDTNLQAEMVAMRNERDAANVELANERSVSADLRQELALVQERLAEALETIAALTETETAP